MVAVKIIGCSKTCIEIIGHPAVKEGWLGSEVALGVLFGGCRATGRWERPDQGPLAAVGHDHSTKCRHVSPKFHRHVSYFQFTDTTPT